MLNWEAYLSGELAIVCKTPEEAKEFMLLCKDSGIPYDEDGWKRMKSRSFRMDGCDSVCWATTLQPSWHVDNHYTSEWIYFTDFVAGQSNPDFNADEFLSMLSGGEA